MVEGNVPHAVAVQALKEADTLLAMQVAYQDSNKPVPYVLGKVYEYLAAGAPILTIVPPGDVKELMLQTPQAVVADYQKRNEITAALKTLAQHLDFGQSTSPDPRWLAQFSRIELTRRLAETFDKVLATAARSR